MKLVKVILLLIIFLPISVSAYTKAVVDITNMSISDLSVALDKGYLTSELLVTLYLERIDAYNSEFNAIREINEKALEEARELDQERAQGKVRSKLHGIPIVVKTNIDVEGLATTAGSLALSDNYPIKDALVIQKLKEAGAIILASTNMSEFAFSAGNSLSSYGQVRNAFNTSYTPYGSSGGSAVAVAISMASASLGTDTNSSVRVPASATGLVGMRPSIGLISSDGIIPYDIKRDTVGVISKTVEDNALILSVINEDNKSYNLEQTSLEGVRIGVVDSYLNGSESSVRVNQATDLDIKALANEKIKLLEDMGAELVSISELLNSYYYNLASTSMSGGSFCDGFNSYINGTVGSIRSFRDLVLARGKIYSLDGYLEECNGAWTYDNDEEKRELFENYILNIFQEYDIDLLVYPTTKNKVYPLNSNGTLNAPGSFLGSVIGYPSITVNMGYIDGFPYGLEFFSLKKEEDLLYQVSYLFEQENNLNLVNSPLTPSLYEIPDYIDVLKYYYEENNGVLKEETKAYFLNYSKNSDTENEREAQNLIKKYQEEELLKKYHNNYFIIILILGLLLIVCLVIFMIVYGYLGKRIKIFYFKLGNRIGKGRKF